MSSGHDNMSNKLMKETIDNILELINIINLSITTWVVPNAMKIAKVIPIHKSSDPSILKKLQTNKKVYYLLFPNNLKELCFKN